MEAGLLAPLRHVLVSFWIVNLTGDLRLANGAHVQADHEDSCLPSVAAVARCLDAMQRCLLTSPQSFCENSPLVSRSCECHICSIDRAWILLYIFQHFFTLFLTVGQIWLARSFFRVTRYVNIRRKTWCTAKNQLPTQYFIYFLFFPVHINIVKSRYFEKQNALRY